MSKDKLLDRIQKLLNLTTSANPHEAAVALEKAQHLMREHALTELDVKAHQIGEARIKSTQSVSKPKDWEVQLIRTVASAFGVSIIWAPGVSWAADYWGRFILVGEKSQVTLAEYTAVVLLRRLVKARDEQRKKLHSYGFRGRAMSPELDTFSKGWILVLRKKIREFANAPEIQELIDARAQQLVDGAEPVTVHNRGRGTSWSHEEGKRAAEEVDLYHGVNEVEQQRLS